MIHPTKRRSGSNRPGVRVTGFAAAKLALAAAGQALAAGERALAEATAPVAGAKVFGSLLCHAA